MNILITGGAGFMGSNFLRFLLNEFPDAFITNLDKLTYAGNLENLKDIEANPRYRFVRGDIADRKAVAAIMQQGVDILFNFAAETHVDRSIMDPDAFIRTDVLGTYSLLEAARKHGIRRYIQVSTDEVYGSTMNGEFHESTPFQPNSPYSASKAGADHLCRAYAVTYGLPVIVTHSCNFFGPYQYPEKLIPLFITNLLEGKKVPVYGQGNQMREWIYTKDYCAALLTVLQKGKDGEAYNVGTGSRFTNLEITRKLLALLGRDDSSIEHVQDRPGHDFRYAVNWDKLASLGWKPAYTFDAALQETVQWYRENAAWWQRIKSGEFRAYYERQYAR